MKNHVGKNWIVIDYMGNPVKMYKNIGMAHIKAKEIDGSVITISPQYTIDSKAINISIMNHNLDSVTLNIRKE